MREYLFRGKRIDYNDWLEGSLWVHCGVPKILSPGNVMGWGVYPESVGQWTGMCDKNGKKIFEGDIINIEYSETTVKNVVVEYVGACFYGSTRFDDWELDNYCNIEVIGTVYENADLLENNNTK